MMVNSHRRLNRFSTPDAGHRGGGNVSYFNCLTSKMSELVNNLDSMIDFNAALWHDKSRNILAKRNIEGLRR